ncbi:hypothetical protein HPB47_005015 [Ixodes persulcatus]|uniref:Uncharacterized protein n=1 Tax=Ixodes persulcatus TaxID=34615 RepID=A0AC60PE66_IXOPE|nr:hypothetical protein HPB47_005015 [Ixodes persulcatus]
MEGGTEVKWLLPGLTICGRYCIDGGDAGSDEAKLNSLVLNGEQAQVHESYKYLGVVLTNKPEYLSDHYAHLRQASAVVVPGLTFANAVLCVPGTVREVMERRQREVGRQALGCHGLVATEAVQGDLRWSSFEASEATSKITYDSRLRLMDRGRWVKKLFVYTYFTGVQTGWRKRLYQLEKKYGFFSTPVTITTDRKWETEIRKRVREEEAARWAETAKSESTLYMYHRYKHEISPETRLYDNSLGSRLLFESRAGGLRTQVYRRRFDQTVESAACRVCGQADETIEHLVLSCTGLQPVQPAECGQATRELALAEALGFGSASSSVADSAGGTNGNYNVDAKPITNGGWRPKLYETARFKREEPQTIIIIIIIVWSRWAPAVQREVGATSRTMLLEPLSWETAIEPALKKRLRSVLENQATGDRNAAIPPVASTPGAARLHVKSGNCTEHGGEGTAGVGCSCFCS